MTSTLRGRSRHIREFIDVLFEAHINPASARPTLGELADCLTDEETAGLPRDEVLLVEPEPCVPHPAGNLRRANGLGVWAHLPGTRCYLCIPADFAVHYKFEISGYYAATVLQKLPRLQGLLISEDHEEVPVDRLIIDPEVVAILSLDGYHRDDIELIVQ